MPETSHHGVGASLPRLEDDRLLEGRGRFVGDIRLPGMLDVAFLRSPVAHADITGIAKPEGAAHQVFTAADLTGVQGIRADSGLPGFRSSIQPVLASDRIRHVGEPIAACVAATRAQAEDIADSIALDYDTLPCMTC